MSSEQHPTATVTLDVITVIPPGDSVVAAYAQHLFRIDGILTHPVAGVDLVHNGKLLPCDGQSFKVNGEHRTLMIGCFIAFHVRNHADSPTPFALTLRGPAITPEPVQYSAQIVPGLFAQEVRSTLNPSPETQPS